MNTISLREKLINFFFFGLLILLHPLVGLLQYATEEEPSTRSLVPALTGGCTICMTASLAARPDIPLSVTALMTLMAYWLSFRLLPKVS